MNQQGAADASVEIAVRAGDLDRLMPMHVILSPTGHIRRHGPTLAKIAGGQPLQGARFLEVFEVRRPRSVTSYAGLAEAAAMPLSLRLREAPGTALKGLVVPLAGGEDGLLVNLSLGIAAVDAVGGYRLTCSDFPATDLTVEMLYLVEAKDAVMHETRNLNRRLQAARTAAEEQALTDTLTGLRNRRAMDDILARYTERGQAFSLMQVDLDFFKKVNDTLGHAAGDHVLREVAAILLQETREYDTVVRAGGDEFVVVFHNLTDPAKLAQIAGRLVQRLEVPIIFEGAACRISGSIGISVSSDYDSPTPDRMLADADMALYASKKAGRARHTFVKPASPPKEERRARPN